jgi:hypothetical protein
MKVDTKQLKYIHDSSIQLFNIVYLPYKKLLTKQYFYNIIKQYIEYKYVYDKLKEIKPLLKQRFRYIKNEGIIFQLYNVYDYKTFTYNKFRSYFENDIGNTYILKVYVPCICGYNYLYHLKEKHYKTANHKKLIKNII